MTYILTLLFLLEIFNVRSSKWWKLDKHSLEGLEIECVASATGYNQIIDQPIHVTKTFTSCFDLIFTTNPNFIKESGVKMLLLKKSSCYVWHVML